MLSKTAMALVPAASLVGAAALAPTTRLAQSGESHGFIAVNCGHRQAEQRCPLFDPILRRKATPVVIMISRFDGLCAPINEKVMALGSRAMNRFKCDVRIGGGVGRAQLPQLRLSSLHGGRPCRFQ